MVCYGMVWQFVMKSSFSDLVSIGHQIRNHQSSGSQASAIVGRRVRGGFALRLQAKVAGQKAGLLSRNLNSATIIPKPHYSQYILLNSNPEGKQIRNRSNKHRGNHKSSAQMWALGYEFRGCRSELDKRTCCVLLLPTVNALRALESELCADVWVCSNSKSFKIIFWISTYLAFERTPGLMSQASISPDHEKCHAGKCAHSMTHAA